MFTVLASVIAFVGAVESADQADAIADIDASQDVNVEFEDASDANAADWHRKHHGYYHHRHHRHHHRPGYGRRLLNKEAQVEDEVAKAEEEVGKAEEGAEKAPEVVENVAVADAAA